MLSFKNILGALLLSSILSGCVSGGPDIEERSKTDLMVFNQGEKDILFKYNKDGVLTSKIYYKTGKREEVKKVNTFYLNGDIKEEMQYSKGLLYGASRAWYRGGNLKMVVIFRNDKPSGIEKWFYKSGEIQSEVKYKRGYLHGKTKIYYPSGKLRAEVMFQNNKPVENEKIYYETGELKYVTDFNNGIIKDSF